MRKHTLLMMLMIFISALAFGQTGDEVKVGNYTAKIIQLENGKYVFDVLEGNTPIKEKAARPFFSMPSPFKVKENAVIIAKWFMTELGKDKNVAYFLETAKAKEMGVTGEDLQFPNPNDN